MSSTTKARNYYAMYRSHAIGEYKPMALMALELGLQEDESDCDDEG